MKNIIIVICISLVFFACNAPTKDKPIIEEQTPDIQSVYKDETNLIEQAAPVNALEKSRSQLEEMTVSEIIDVYIYQRNKIIIVGGYEYYNNIGYFEFVSHEKIQWYLDTSGYVFYPYLYILDETNLLVEIFYYFIGLNGLGNEISAGKYFINISKENLIDRFVEDYQHIKLITGKYQPEDLIFSIQFDTVVYDNGSLQGDSYTEIKKDAKVEIIDILFGNFDDEKAAVVRIKNEDVTGWVSTESAGFLKKEVNGTVNGTWLYNAVKNVIKNYGANSVKGEITGDSIPLRSAPSEVSEQLLIIQNSELSKEVSIEEVSANIDVIDGIESAWYKIRYYVLVGPYDTYDLVSGWVFGSSIEIYPFIN